MAIFSACDSLSPLSTFELFTANLNPYLGYHSLLYNAINFEFSWRYTEKIQQKAGFYSD